MADDGDSNVSQKPLLGVIMCCTSIPPERRSQLALLAVQMGAAHKLDLTSDVTHLIVGDTDTPKYKYVARERPDVKVLMPEWIEAVRDVWMQGGETDVEALEAEYRLPTFAGLRICLTGFEDHAVRKKLEETVKKNGGEYRGDLNKEVTHLIANRPSGQKYTYAKSWGLRIISLEWLQQSLERGMILDELLYDPLMEAADRGRDAWVKKPVSPTSAMKRPRHDQVVQPPARKLRRTASARFSSQNEGIWSDIVGGGFEQDQSRKSEWDDQRDSASTVQQGSDAHMRTKAAPDEPYQFTDESRLRSESVRQETRSLPSGLSNQQGLFAGKRFFVHGFDTKKTAILHGHLRSHNAEILPDLMQLSPASASTSDDTTYVLVPHTASEHDIPSTPESTSQPTVVTDMWIERCLHKKTFVQPKDNITSSLFRFPVPGFERLIIASTAFEGIDLLQLSKTVTLMGATYDEYLTQKACVLVCNSSSPNRDKVRMALEWKVPAVSADWLWDSLRSGRREPFDPYLIHTASQAGSNETSLQGASAGSKQIQENTEGPLPTTAKHDTRKKKQRTGNRGEQEVSRNHRTDLIRQSNKSRNALSRQSFSDDSAMTINAADEGPQGASRTDTKQNGSVAGRPISDGLPEPLQERSPNSPPKPQITDARPANKLPPELNKPQPESMAPEINSLLAHYQQQNPTVIAPNRQKRRIFGRAESNLSNRSTGSVRISRASSVDTMNTDGVGTPLEPVHPTLKRTESKHALTASLLADHDEQAEEDELARQKMQMTQVGYEDLEGEASRERLMRKMGGGVDVARFKVATPKAKSQGTVKDIVGVGVQSVSKRTRQAGAK